MADAIQYSNHSYRVVTYSPVWPDWYAEEAQRIRKALNNQLLDIQHVGSTSIPGVAAKPQLDILVQVHSITEVDTYNDRLKDMGYEAYGDMLHKCGRLFSKWKNGEKTVNLHFYEISSPIVWEYTAVRDFLRSNPDEAQKYSELKLDLYSKYPEDYLAYRKIKDPYIYNLQERIKAAG